MQYTFDPIKFLTEGYKIAPAVIFVVIAFTYLAGVLGLKDKKQLAFAMVLGFCMGGGLQFAAFTPKSYTDYFTILVYALVMAATPSLLYDQLKAIVTKAITKLSTQFVMRKEPPK